MKISELENLILENTSKLNLERAKHLLKNGELNKISINKRDDYYNIYGNFKCENKIQSYNAHLKIDFKNKRITSSKCECSIFLEGDSKNSIYLCEHLTAIGLGFIQQVKKKLNKSDGKKEDLRKDRSILFNLSKINNFSQGEKVNSNKFDLIEIKEKLQLNISLKEVLEDENSYFKINLFIGINTLYPIINIQEFIMNLNKSKDYYICKELTYTIDKYYFSKQDEDVLEYIYEYILISKDNNKSNSIRLDKKILRRFLKKILSKKIKFNYSYQTYICEIKDEDLPISFTLKQVKDDYVLTTQKVFPIPLNEQMDVFFFDRKIYIPSQAQIKVYKIFYYLLQRYK